MLLLLLLLPGIKSMKINSDISLSNFIKFCRPVRPNLTTVSPVRNPARLWMLLLKRFNRKMFSQQHSYKQVNWSAEI